MKMNWTIIISFFSLNMAFAKLDRTLGEWSSGGGNGLVCFERDHVVINDQIISIKETLKKNEQTLPDKLLPFIKSIELYDLYEAKKSRGFESKPPKIIKIKDEETFYDYFSRVARRFKEQVPLMERFVELSKDIVSDTNIIWHDFALKHQNDLGNVALPSPNCHIITMAAQVNYNNVYFVHIDQRLFNHPKHSRQSQASLTLHELLYAYGRKNFNHKKSGITRNLVRYFISYHESITQASTSKMIFDSGLNSKEKPYGITDDNNLDHYRNIALIEEMNWYFINDFESLREDLDRFFNYENNYNLFKKIQSQFKLEKLRKNNEAMANYAYMSEMVEIGVKNSHQKDIWLSFKDLLDKELIGLRGMVRRQISSYVINLYSGAKAGTHLSKKDLSNLKGRIMLAFSDMLRDRTPLNEFVQSVYAFIQRDSHTISADFIHALTLPYTICSTYHPCYDPLTFKTIIPEQGVSDEDEDN